MQHYVGLDVSVKETSVCIVDKAGKVEREVKVATKPVAILAVLTEEGLAIERIGLEAGPLSQWLYSALAEAGLPVICVETRHMKAALSAQINKSDRNDARGIAQMMRVGLYRPVLSLAAETADEALSGANARAFVRVAGLVGDTQQAVKEAEIARALGYHCGLLSLGAWRDASDAQILTHCRHVAETIPLFGFYLQPAVGGRRLPYAFWREFAEIANVVAIKVAPFDRYATLDVVRAIADAGRDDIALYTGNDDSIVADLVTDVPVFTGGRAHTRHFVGGLLGQWAVWTHTAVRMLGEIRAWRASGHARDAALHHDVRGRDDARSAVHVQPGSRGRVERPQRRAHHRVQSGHLRVRGRLAHRAAPRWHRARHGG